jgi:hypothetical protein
MPVVCTHVVCVPGLADKPMKKVLGSPEGTVPRSVDAVTANASQLAAAPPFWLPQLQCHGPLPLTADAVPDAHRLAVGALVSDLPFDDPHTPLTDAATAKDAAAPFQ